ncbi:flagellar filament capping protein FliD, partial [Marinospirillum sp.]|uniref:flagellar filament capping protein FliD n=1 Tax=Marinospirillum sp. TaxID=2183934 RepID=UPI00286FE547
SGGSLETGTLKLDESEFKARMDEDMDQVIKVIGDEDNGFAARMEETAKLVTSGGIIDGEVVEGTIATRTDGLNDKADRLENRMEDTLDRLDSYEQRLYDQFNAVESTTASLQAQGQQIQAQLGGGGGLASLL